MMATKSDAKTASPAKKAAAPQTQGKTIGIGRGKQINFTAKHYDFSDSSDNSDRDSTDNEISLDEEVSLEREEVKTIESERATESNSKSRDSSAEPAQKVSKKSAETRAKSVESKGMNVLRPKSIAAGPVLIDNDSLDNNEFAKAIFVDAKATVKSKSQTATKKAVQEKRMPPPIIASVNRFKTNLLSRPVAGRPFADLKPNLGDAKQLVKLPELSGKGLTCRKVPIEVAKAPPNKTIKHEPVEEVTIDADDSKSNDIDVVTPDEVKTESSVKRKLNIHEYLKRKGTNATGAGGKVKCRTDVAPPKAEDKIKDEDVKKTSNPMYEEIIIVSVGCGTDISIPELSFGNKISIESNACKSKETVLLSDIQTTIVKANSAIELGKISSTSLISSIQNEILKKSTETKAESAASKQPPKAGNAQEETVHGENKVIMHLRKDRIRPRTATIAIQTEPYFQFPPLERLPSTGKERSDLAAHETNRSNRNYRAKHFSESSYYSDEEHSMAQRRSRHSEFINSITHSAYGTDEVRNRVRRRSNRSKSSYRREHYSRQRTISRSLSQSSDSSTSSSDSSSSTASSSSASSVSSSKSLNSYGDSSTKSYYNDDRFNRHRFHQPYDSRSDSRSRPSSVRSTSPGLQQQLLLSICI